MIEENARELCVIWNAVEELIPVNNRTEAATELVSVMVDLRDGIETLHEAADENNYLDIAIRTYLAENELDDEEDEDEDYYDE